MTVVNPQLTPYGEEPCGPYPPRFWWLKRISALAFIVLAALAGLRWWWGHEAQRRFNEMVAAAHARGEPILPEDFDSTPVADAQNAALSLLRAAAAVARDGRFAAFENAYSGGQLTPPQILALSAILASSNRSLQLLRQARSQSGIDWGSPGSRPVLGTLSASMHLLNEQRDLARLARRAALNDHQAGNDREAIEHVRDLLRQAHVLELARSSLVTHLVALGISEMTTNLLVEQIAPDLTVEGGPSSAAPALPATRGQVRSLIAELLDSEGQWRVGAVRSWCGERAMSPEMADEYARTTLGGRVAGWLVRPASQLDALRAGDHAAMMAQAVSQSDWRAARGITQTQDERDDDESALGFFTHAVEIYRAPGDRAVLIDFHIRTERAAAAIALAIRLYRADHSGRYPPSLKSLVPSYLPQVPVDPMAAGARSFSYKSAASPPVIYSVGDDGKDDGGTSLPNNNAPYRWRYPDAVFPLEVLPSPPASTAPSAPDAS